jgi:hypothetical protein
VKNFRKEGDNVMENRDAYTKKAEALVKEWTAEMEKLKAKAQQAEADAQIKYEKELDELGRKKKAVEQKIEEVKSSTEAAWTDLKQGLDEAFSDLKLSIDRAWSRFK